VYILQPPLKRYKTRRINFLSSISPPSTSYSDPGIQRASTNTEALASLAWNGVVPSASASSSTFEPSEESLYFSERDAHPPNMKTNRPRHGPEPNRRWTFAMAMADEDVTDEVLVEQLERMRSGASLQGGMDHPFHSSLVWMQHSSRHGDSPPARSFSSPNVHDAFLHPHVLPRSQTTDFEDATAWPTARKALLCCREIVRTEKRYMDELKALINGEVCIAKLCCDVFYSRLVDVDNNTTTCFNAGVPARPPTRVKNFTPRVYRRSVSLGCVYHLHGVRRGT
jgi:hypothetical protein